MSATTAAVHQEQQEVARLRTSQLDFQTLKKKKKSPMCFQVSHLSCKEDATHEILLGLQ